MRFHANLKYLGSNPGLHTKKFYSKIGPGIPQFHLVHEDLLSPSNKRGGWKICQN